MAALLSWSLVAIAVSHLCSLLEVTLLSVRTSALLEQQAAGSVGAARLLAIKRDRIDDAIGAVLVLNTVAITVGATLAGAQAAALFGEGGVGVFSGVLTVLLLLFAEIIPKTLAARHAGRLAAFTGRVLPLLLAALAPVLVVTRSLVNALARRARERLTRREFALFVGAAPQEGAITLAEARLIQLHLFARRRAARGDDAARDGLHDGRRSDRRRPGPRGRRRRVQPHSAVRRRPAPHHRLRLAPRGVEGCRARRRPAAHA
jgi:CBS domain containing-hemolysin-like protein